MNRTTIPAANGRLSIDDVGSGDGLPVVLAHSFAGSSRQWAPQMSHLRRSRRVVALDLHGHGQSTATPDAAYDVDAFAGDIAAVVEALALVRFVLVGHSLGGAAAIAYAAAHPEHVAGLVLVATPGRLPDEQVAQIEGALAADYDGTMAMTWKRLLANATPATRQTVEDEQESLPKEAAAAIIRSTFEFDPAPPLEAYPGPKLTISTPNEGPVTELHELVPGIEHRTVKGTSHWIQLDEPDAFDRLLDGFLAEVERKPVGARSAG
jgi:pimeloyl-ACP methyl ester carboxylesterase